MNRLTDINKCIVHYKKSYTDEEISNIIVKLGKLEDLEEEIGCPLEVVFKALKEGAYLEIKGNTISDSDMVYHKNITFGKEEITFQRTDESYICINRRLKDYKKTWWLKEDKSE